MHHRICSVCVSVTALFTFAPGLLFSSSGTASFGNFVVGDTSTLTTGGGAVHFGAYVRFGFPTTLTLSGASEFRATEVYAVQTGTLSLISPGAQFTTTGGDGFAVTNLFLNGGSILSYQNANISGSVTVGSFGAQIASKFLTLTHRALDSCGLCLCVCLYLIA